MLRRNRIRQGRTPENRYIAAFRRAEIAEPFVCIENSANQAECESHSPVRLVDEEVVEHDEEAASQAVLQENPASNLADDVMKSHNESLFAKTEARSDEEEATFEVAYEAATAAQLEEEKLMQSLPMRAVDLANSLNVCECAGTEQNQLAAESNDKKPTEARYDDEFLPNAEWQNLKEEISFITDLMNGHVAPEEVENENEIIQDFLKHVEKASMKDASSIKAAKKKEEGSHLAAEDAEICIQDAEEVEDPAEEIFQKWSIEEIRHYYLLMWQQATAEDDSAIRAENSMREHANLKIEFEAQAVMGTTHQKDEEPWHDAIPAFEDEDGRTKLKLLEEKQRKKVKMKKALRRIGEFRVWSRRKKKPAANKVNQVSFLKHM